MQLINNDVNGTETTIMGQPEVATALGPQEAALQMTEDSIVEVEETSLINLLNTEACRACNITRCNELRQKLIDQ